MDNFYLIGLTGNLGCGKSTVRRLLEQFGARGIDADLLAHLALARGTPAWNTVVETFGGDLIRFDGEIDRRKLGTRVFGNPDALKRLEEITHPAVTALVKEILRANEKPVVVLEAIKLVESGLYRLCDALWVVTCGTDEEIQRVVRDRGMRPEDARARLAAQSSPDEKLKLANVVIDNSRDLQTTRLQVQNAWKNTVRVDQARDKNAWLYDRPTHPAPTPVAPPLPEVKPESRPEPAPVVPPQVEPPLERAPIVAPKVEPLPEPAPVALPKPEPRAEPAPAAPPKTEPPTATTPAAPSKLEPTPVQPPASEPERVQPPVPIQAAEPPPPVGNIEVRRARRSDLDALAIALAKREQRDAPLSREETIQHFGERGYRISVIGDQIVALAAWEAENLVAVTRDFWAESQELAPRALPPLLALVEQDARALLCEIAVILMEPSTPPFMVQAAQSAGYQLRELSALHRLWKQAVADRIRPGDQIWVKRLREGLATQPF